MSLEGAGTGKERCPRAMATIEQTRAATKNTPMVSMPAVTNRPRTIVLTSVLVCHAPFGDSRPIRVNTTGIERMTRTLGPWA